MPPCQAHFPQHHDRRQFLLKAGGGIGGLALAGLLQQETRAASDPLAPRHSHFAPRAKRVIWLFMHGGPSHMDLFDPKPDLAKHAGQPLPGSFGEVMTRRKVAKNPLLGPVKPFRPRGQSGLEISDFLPHIASHADDLCVLRGCHGDSVNHPQSVYQMNTGSILMGKPSLGAWVAYGLGTENRDMLAQRLPVCPAQPALSVVRVVRPAGRHGILLAPEGIHHRAAVADFVELGLFGGPCRGLGQALGQAGRILSRA